LRAAIAGLLGLKLLPPAFDDPADRIGGGGFPDRGNRWEIDRVHRLANHVPVPKKGIAIGSTEPVRGIRAASPPKPGIVVETVPIGVRVVRPVINGRTIGRRVIVRIVEERIVVWIVGVEIRIVVVTPIGPAEKQADGEAVR
jgi:hypothetical protein